MQNQTEEAINQLASLAMEADITDPIDWGMLNINEENAYKLMASNVIQQMNELPEDHRLIVSMATVTKLLVENFVLNIQLKGKENVAKGL